MNCSSIDLKAYFLGELDRGAKSACADHITRCDDCHEELERLRLTQTALMTMPDEEIPQRIAFVSDRVFEPRWWQAIWRSGPAMGFASAALLSCAILVHGFTRPAPVVVASAPVTQVEQVDHVTQVTQARIERKIEEQVKLRVAELGNRQALESAQLVAAVEKKFQSRQRADLVSAQETIRMYQQQMGRLMVAYNPLSNSSNQGGAR